MRPVAPQSGKRDSRSFGSQFMSHRNIPCWTSSCWRSPSASSWRALVTPMPVNGC